MRIPKCSTCHADVLPTETHVCADLTRSNAVTATPPQEAERYAEKAEEILKEGEDYGIDDLSKLTEFKMFIASALLAADRAGAERVLMAVEGARWHGDKETSILPDAFGTADQLLMDGSFNSGVESCVAAARKAVGE